MALERKQSVHVLEAESVDVEDKRYTIAYMCRIGRENKKGFLMKQGKFIGR